MTSESAEEVVRQPWERMREFIEASQRSHLDSYTRSMEPSEAVRAMLRLSPAEQQQFLRLLSPELAAQIMDDLPGEHAGDLLERLGVEHAADIVEALTSDHGADLLNELDSQDAEAILEEMLPEQAVRVRQLITYPEDVAGGLMGSEDFACSETASIEDLLNELRSRREELGHLPQRVLLVDADGRLAGAVDVADVLLADKHAQLSEFSQTVAPVSVNMPLDELEDYFDRHETLGAPVIDDAGRIVGRLRRRAVSEALALQAQGDQLKSVGIVGGEELRTMSVFTRSRRRLSWLSINILLNIMAASVIAIYADTISAVIALAVFLPIVSDMSGCSGNQAVAVSMRELTLGVIRPRDLLRVWWQEVSVGLLNGLALGLLLGAVAFLWQGNALLGIVVGLALALNTVVAVSIGGTVPLILKSFHADPAIASGPILTTITDMCGFLLVLGLATLTLPWLI